METPSENIMVGIGPDEVEKVRSKSYLKGYLDGTYAIRYMIYGVLLTVWIVFLVFTFRAD